MLGSAIPEHLRKERKCPVSTPPNYVPPYPGYCARFPTKVDNLVLAIIGAQYSSGTYDEGAGILTIKSFMTDTPETVCPSSWEMASVTDKRGFFNIAVFAYWPSHELYQKWEIESGFQTWWKSSEREGEEHGWFKEILRPSVERFETVFTNNEHPEGVANMQEKVSGDIKEHSYWGSMRDRFAAAQDDNLEGENWTTGRVAHKSGTESKRICVPGKKNLTIIRSGQDWSDTLQEERKLYLETMHPVLISGMNFLRDSGRDVGCYSMNLWNVVDPKTHEASLEKTFGLGYFDDLASLECWSKTHQTHVSIFGGFLLYAKKLGNVMSLRLFHEVYVLEQSQQSLEYVGCHEETSMMNSL